MLGIRFIKCIRNQQLCKLGFGLTSKKIDLQRSFHVSRSLANASCLYRNGYVVFTLPLPSRNEHCEFTLLPLTNTVKTLAETVQGEDKGVDRFTVYSMDGNRIAHSTPIDVLVQNDFKIVINERSYDIITPKQDSFPINHEDQLSTTKNLISQLYTDINVQAYKENRERAVTQYLESLKRELKPMEEQKSVIDMKAARRTNTLVWAGLGYMALQFGFLARLTWWEYSWDIMEPVTYFVTYASSMVFYAYFVMTREDFNYPEAKARSHLLSFHKESDRKRFDVNDYNAKKEQAAKLEHELKLLKSPPVFVDMNKVIERS